MVLDQLKSGASRHLNSYDGDTKRLAFLLCLPMVDGVFPMLLVTGAVDTFSSMVAVALTVFTGAGALAVLYSSTETREEAVKMVKKVSPLVFTGAVLVSLVAPVFETVFYVERLSYAAGIVLMVIAAKMASVPYSGKFSTPGIIVTGMVLSVNDLGAVALSLQYVVPAIATVTVALLGLYGAAMVNSSSMNLNYIRKGGAVVLLIIALSLFGLNIPSTAGLAVLALSLVASFRDPLNYF